MDLYDEVENPKARGFLELWIERKSCARYAMMATLAGVVIAVISKHGLHTNSGSTQFQALR